MRAHQNMVFTTAARLTGSDRQAEDIAQEVFIKAYQRFAQLRGGAAAGGWLRTVATHLALNYLTRHRRRWRLFSELTPVDSDDEESALPELPAADRTMADLDAEQQRLAIEEAIRRLPDHQRVPLVLYHFEELSYEQIAVRLGVSLAKVKTDIRRSRLALLPLLEASGIAGGGFGSGGPS